MWAYLGDDENHLMDVEGGVWIDENHLMDAEGGYAEGGYGWMEGGGEE